MIDDQDVRDAFARMVDAAPPPPSSIGALTAGRRAHRRRTLWGAGGTATAVAAVVAASSVIGGGIGGGGGGGTPAAAPAPSPTAALAPVVPGISPAQARVIIDQCFAHYPEKPAALQIFNAGPTPWGTSYLLYGPTTATDCLHATEGDWRPGVVNKGQTYWLTGQRLIVDRAIADGAADDRDPGTYTIEGRVDPSVVKVEIRFGSRSTTVPPLNGTFMAAMPVLTLEVDNLRTRTSIKALNANGGVVYQSAADGSTAPTTGCWVTPGGKKIGDTTPVFTSRTTPPRPPTCGTAFRWR